MQILLFIIQLLRMISVESHSKQIKLLNDYIISLEKQISTAKKEQEEQQKGSGVSSDEQKRTNEEITKLRNENGQLKYSAYKLDEQLRRFTSLQRELAATREQLSRERQEKQVLEKENNQLKEGHSGYEVRKRTTEEELEKRKTVYEEDRVKLQNELEDLRKMATLKERRCEELTQLLNQEKKNTASRLFNLQVTNNQVVRLKNDTISKLTRELDQIKSHHNRQLASVSETRLSMNDQVRDLVKQLNDSRIEVQMLKRQISDNRGSGDRKNEELANALNNLQAKSGELDSYIRKSNEQKNNLMKIIDRLEEEKRVLEKQNENNLSPKLLADIARERDDLRNKLAATQEQLNELLGHRQHLIEQLQQAGQTIHEMDKRIIYEIGENQKLDKLLYNSDQLLGEKTKQLEELTAAKQTQEIRLQEIISNLEKERDSKVNSLSSTSQQVNSLNQTITQLKAQIEVLNNAIMTLTNQSATQLRKAESDKLSLETKLKQVERIVETSKQEFASERKNLTEQIESLSQQLKAAIQSSNHDVGSEEKRLTIELQQLSLKLKTAEKTIQTNKNEYAIQYQRLSEEIESLSLQLKTVRKNMEMNESLYNTDKKGLKAEIQSLIIQLRTSEQTKQTNQKDYILNLHSKDAEISSLALKLKNAESIIETTRNQYNTDRKRQSTKIEQLSEDLKDAEKRSQKYRLKVEELTRNLNQLQSQQLDKIQPPTYSQAEVQSLTAKFNKTINDLKTTSEQTIQLKSQEILELKLNTQKAELKLKKLHQEWQIKEEEWKLKEQTLQKQIDQLLLDNQKLQNQKTRSSISSIFESHTSNKHAEIEALKHTINVLEKSLNEQKIVIDDLNNLQTEMHVQIQTLEASNTLLRKQVIGAINNEEASRKELIQNRSRNGSILLNSRININDVSFEKQYARGSFMAKRRATASSSLFSNLLEGRLNSCKSINGRNRDRKKSTHLKSSLVDELRQLNNDRPHHPTDDVENTAQPQ